tara:strand:+ start:740 stop:910 length:171 start_codon:yes stop_codon:yes gene_type:complete
VGSLKIIVGDLGKLWAARKHESPADGPLGAAVYALKPSPSVTPTDRAKDAASGLNV